MNFEFETKHKVLRKAVREFAEEEIKPYAREIDERDEYPLEIYKKLVKMGYPAVRIPEIYEGLGFNVLDTVIVGEEMARVSCSVGLLSGIEALTSLPITLFGSEEQKEKYLTGIAKGKFIGAFALTEPCCGSDAGSIQTKAVEQGDEYVIEGTKTFISAGLVADFFVVFARTGKVEDKHRGISAFIVERDENVETRKVPVMGFRGTGTAEVTFKGCHVPKENLIGEKNEGFSVAMFSLDESRIYASSAGIGLSQAAYEESLKYAKQRVAFGKPLIKRQAIQRMLTDMAMDIEIMRLLTYKAAWLKDKGDLEYVKLASMAKLYSAMKTVEITRNAIQIFGGYGYSRENNLERYYRDAKLVEIGEGTNEVQRYILMKSLLGKIFI